MIPEPETYFRQFVPARDALLRELEKEAQREEIPIVGPMVGELLYILARAMQAGRILELGTATGYSTIYFANACSAPGGRVITLEIDQDMADRARVNMKKAGLDHLVEIRVGDALEEIAALQGPFDLIFLDIEKVDYIRTLPHCLRLLRKGGLLVADNIGFNDADEFNHAIANHPQWRAVHLLSFLPLHSPEKDGLCLALRI
jgi:predicted O-methyltransferase YrrM